MIQSPGRPFCGFPGTKPPHPLAQTGLTVFEAGKIIDLRYYAEDHQVRSLTCAVIARSDTGIIVETLNGQEQWFPWSSVQRLIVEP